MASHSHIKPQPEPTPDEFRRKSRGAFVVTAAAGVIGIAAAVVLGYLEHSHHPEHPDYFRRFYFSYLTAFAYFLAIGIGAMAFVLVQYLARAGWSVQVRRIAENLMMTVPVMGLLALPLLYTVLSQKGDLYVWALPDDPKLAAHHAGDVPAATPKEAKEKDAAHHTAVKPGEAGDAHADGAHHSETHRPFTLNALTYEKRPWLNPWFFTIRIVFYFAVWTAIAVYYRRHSIAQDADGHLEHTELMQKWSGISIVVLLLTMTFAAFDLFMSLDPHWFSTMFGVYYLAGCFLTFFATMIILVALSRRWGALRGVTKDHFHDLGKFQFGFTFFWGYVAFSQFMLLWYANLPETTPWFSRRGATTAFPTEAEVVKYGGYGAALDKVIPDYGASWRPVAIALLVGHLLIPFAGLLSRHVKRKLGTALFWAFWALAFHYVNMYWIVMPEMRTGFHPALIDLACFVGFLGIFAATWLKVSGSARLVPAHDPRLPESVAFTNI
ncbi:MAG: hypothetical protein ACAI43_08320 [Phycisphaerae bacterium]|nr:hypothetical protein [Tepidisphaeraceae bacterium]